MFPYFQEFTVPDTGERLVRKGFIALGAVEDYSAGVVHRHEQTLSGPKKDRLELLRHTHAHFGQIFMLYPDPAGAIDALLDEAAAAPPLAEVADEYGAVHRMWKIADAARIQQLMADKKLLIADGHHRYETALAFRNENPDLPGADRVMMTFVNMHSPGLKILATHRLVSGIPPTDSGRVPAPRRGRFHASKRSIRSTACERAWAESGGRTVIGAAIGDRLFLLEDRNRARRTGRARPARAPARQSARASAKRPSATKSTCATSAASTPAVEEARQGAAQIAFLLKPASVQQVADTSFAGGVMPQKSTDFYPKLLSGLTIYKLE